MVSLCVFFVRRFNHDIVSQVEDRVVVSGSDALSTAVFFQTVSIAVHAVTVPCFLERYPSPHFISAMSKGRIYH
jgi:hypothetical protein